MWRGLDLVSHYSPFFPGSSTSRVEGRRKTRRDSRGHIKWEAACPWWKEVPALTWAQSISLCFWCLCQCVDLLIDIVEHGVMCFWKELFIFLPVPSIIENSTERDSHVCLYPTNNLCPQFLSVWMSSYLIHDHKSFHLLCHFLWGVFWSPEKYGGLLSVFLKGWKGVVEVGTEQSIFFLHRTTSIEQVLSLQK